MEGNKEIYPTVWRKVKKKKTTRKFCEFIMKVDVERLGCNDLLQDFKFMKNIKITMDVWWNNRRKESVYKKSEAVTLF